MAAPMMLLRFGGRGRISSKIISLSRTLLTQTYHCDEAWKQQLSSPVLQKFQPYGFALKVQENIDKSGKVTAVDMDILANRLHALEQDQLDFVQDIFYKFRHTKQTTHAIDSMSHAFIRALLQFGEIDRLMAIIKDKVHYGIFLDDYTANLLMDYFIKHDMYKEAGEIACEMMLQENLFHPITRALAWYCCHTRLSQIVTSANNINSIELNDLNDPPPPVDEDDIKYRRVGFISEPWYDDHFDIPAEHQRLGKTLLLVARHEQLDQSETALTRSYHLIGCGFYRKFDMGLKLMRDWLKSDIKNAAYQSQVEIFKALLSGVKTHEPRPLPEPGLRTMQHLYPYITAEQKSEYLRAYDEIYSELIRAGKLLSGDALEVGRELKKRVEEVIAKLGADDESKLQQLYASWASEREQLLKQQIEKLEQENKKQELAERLLSLKQKEEKLRYFDSKVLMDLSISERPVVEQIEEAVEEEQFVAPPGERTKSGADTMKKKKK